MILKVTSQISSELSVEVNRSACLIWPHLINFRNASEAFQVVYLFVFSPRWNILQNWET